MDQFHRSAPRHRKEESVRAALKASEHSVVQSRSAHWLIESKSDPASSGSEWQPIGLASLAEIMLGHKRAELLVGIYDQKDRGNGAAIIATLLLFDLSFNQVGLHKLTSIVHADNELSQRTTLSLGFLQEGLRKQHLYDPYTKTWLDCFDNGLTEDDFRNNSRLARLSMRLLQRNITAVEAKFGASMAP
jgi:RimJ/RimL family protein N-acetyltransferase